MGEKSGSLRPESQFTRFANPRRWSVVWLLFAASMINYLDRATISISLPLISRDLHLGPTDKGILLSAFFWSYALMQVPIGWSADRFNLRWLYAAAFAVWSLGQALAGAAKTLAFLIMTRIILGIGESIYLPGGTKIVTLLFSSEERGFPCGIFDFGTRCGMTLGLLAVPLLLVHYGWRTTFVIIGAAALLWLIPWLAISPQRLGGKKSPGSSSETIAKAEVPVGRQPLSRLWNRDLIGICLGFFCFDYYWYLLVTWLPDYLVTVRHLTVLRAGAYSAAPFLVFGVCEPVGGWIADRLIRLGFSENWTRKGMVTIGLLTGLFLIPAEHAASPAATVWFIIGASFVGLATGNLIVILQCCAPAEEVGLWTGFENLFGNIAGVLAPLLTGILISRTGSYSPGFDLAVFVLLAGIGFYWFVVGNLKAKKPVVALDA
ncbi:MAG TPA: MFS transporter [Terriglobia bacterium]|nr:MFS transporter [Terriglobia bacterium]